MSLNGISARKKDSRSTGQSQLGYTVGLPVARIGRKWAEHSSTPTLLECRLDRSIARVELVLSEFEPHSVYPRTEVSVRAVCAWQTTRVVNRD